MVTMIPGFPSSYKSLLGHSLAQNVWFRATYEVVAAVWLILGVFWNVAPGSCEFFPTFRNKVKVKVNFTLVQTTRPRERETRCIALLLL